MEFQDEQPIGLHVWEGDHERSWEDLIESDGKLVSRQTDGLDQEEQDAQSRARKRAKLHLGGKRWMLRSLLLCIDASHASGISDFKPSRLQCVCDASKQFALEFFDEKPLSMLGVLCLRGGKVTKMCEFSRSADTVSNALDSIAQLASSGSCTLQNVLSVSSQIFNDQVLDYSSKELVVVASAVNVVDAVDVYQTLNQLPKNLKVSVIHTSCAVEVYRRICKETLGNLSVVANTHVSQLKELFLVHLTPPEVKLRTCHMIQMGFPSQTVSAPCILNDQLVNRPYFCPQCQGVLASLPCTCRSCNLQLLSSSHLARSFHHLFPVNAFERKTSPQVVVCFTCQHEAKISFHCPVCHCVFCRACEEMIHDTLFACPGCVS